MADYIDLAPSIYRQRLVVEAIPVRTVDKVAVQTYLVGLSDVRGMQLLADPVTHCPQRRGWVHWSDLCAHLYAWDESRFISVDTYTCRAFATTDASAFTEPFFNASAITTRSS